LQISNCCVPFENALNDFHLQVKKNIFGFFVCAFALVANVALAQDPSSKQMDSVKFTNDSTANAEGIITKFKRNKIYKAIPGTVFIGLASYYANKFSGRRTAYGETFYQSKFTCACNILPLGTWIKVTNLRNKRSIVVKINDRIHPRMRRIVDLTKAGAQKLGFVSSGLTRVKVEVLGKHKPKEEITFK